MTFDKIVLVKKPTQLEELLKRHSTTSQVKFYLESLGDSYDFYKESHDSYKNSLHEIISSIPSKVPFQIIDNSQLPTYQFGGKDLVVSVGDPGLFVNLAKYVGEQPVISVNPDSKRYTSVLASCETNDFSGLLHDTLNDKFETESLTMAEAKTDDGQIMYALNDFFIGQKTHVSARYMVNYECVRERQSSSGIIVSTGTGSTGWLTSIVKGAEKISYGESKITVPFNRNANYLIFAVREPFPSKITETNIVYGVITQESSLKITSNMPENGVIFSDGVESDYINFSAGLSVVIIPSKKKVNLIKY